ncbi:MAG: RnfABCDGE type electron transport complex subunit G [Clostridiales bacterium]|nr:RnfABCDGE type electron transport complex subunit G [Clostridiales bacterium]
MNKSVVKNSLILAAFTLVCGLVLGFVYDLTKDRIAAADLEALQEAYQEVFEEASSFAAIDYDEEEANDLVSEAGYSDTIDDVQGAYDSDGNLLGYVFTVTAKDGSQGSITLCIGMMLDGTMNGYSITDSSETAGLGSKAGDEEFAGQFVDVLVEAFEVVSYTTSDVSMVESISGATITSKAVANACNAAILYFDELTDGALSDDSTGENDADDESVTGGTEDE